MADDIEWDEPEVIPVGNGKAAIESIFPGVRVTSNYRPPNSSLARKNPKSLHTRTRAAVDIDPKSLPPGTTYESFIQGIRDAGYDVIQDRDEVRNPTSWATGPHYHAVLGQQKGSEAPHEIEWEDAPDPVKPAAVKEEGAEAPWYSWRVDGKPETRGVFGRLKDYYLQAGQTGTVGVAARWLNDFANTGMDDLKKIYPKATPDELETLHDKVINETQRRLREEAEEKNKNDPTWKGWEQFVADAAHYPTGGLDNYSAAVIGSLLGSAGPESFFAPGGSVAVKALSNAGINMAADAGAQALDVSSGVSDEIDPIQIAVNGVLGGGLVGLAHLASKLGGRVVKGLEGGDGIEVPTPEGPKVYTPDTVKADTSVVQSEVIPETTGPDIVVEGRAPQNPVESLNTETAVPQPDVPEGAVRASEGNLEGIPAPTVDVPPQNIVDRITEDLKTAGTARAEQTQLYKEERAKRFKEVRDAQRTGKGQLSYKDSLAALKGDLPKADFEAVGSKYTQTDIDDLFDHVTRTETLTPAGKLSAYKGLTDILEGRVPQPKSLEHLSETFPREFVKTVLSKRSTLSKSMGALGEAWNLPKSLMSSVDLSAPLRQGIGLIHRGEYWDAFGKMFKYAVSDKSFDALDNSIKTHPNYALAEEAGLAVTTTGGKLGQHEDVFRSHLAERIPLYGSVVRGSERAYVGFLNKLRFDTFNSLLKDAEGLGVDLSDPAANKAIANYINIMTGRGGLGKLEPAGEALNAVLFSPRLISSRLQMLSAPVAAVGKGGFIAELPVGMRREAAKSYAGMVSAYTTIAGLAMLAGHKIEDDPRSSDFGKIKDGNTRIDMGAGLLQYIVAGTKALTREGTSVKSGEARELTKRGDTPLDSDLKFLMNKAHPSLSLFLDQQRGANVVGEKFEWGQAILSRLAPMGAPDIIETLKEHGSKGAFYGVLGLLGGGLQNFDVDAPKEKEPKAPANDIEWETP